MSLSRLQRAAATSSSIFLAAIIACSGTGEREGDSTLSTAILSTDPLQPLALGEDVLTHHNDNMRSGATLAETRLTPSNVNGKTFGRLYSRHVEGQIYAQPLYISNVATALGPRNLVIVATASNWLYAFDADSTDTNPGEGIVWSTLLGPANRVACMGAETHGPVGVTSTPVIDRASGTIYVAARVSSDESTGDYYLFAVDVRSGALSSGRTNQKRITTETPPTNAAGNAVEFDPRVQRNRPGLLLTKAGGIYVAFGALNGDNGNYHGWIFGYDAATFNQVGAFVTTPNAVSSSSPLQWGALGGGVWQGGQGLASDDESSVYFFTGNGACTGECPGLAAAKKLSPPDLGNTIVKLRTGATPSAGLTLDRYYVAPNWKQLNTDDIDLGASGPMLLPNGALIGGGKQGVLYLMDQTTLLPSLGAAPWQAFNNTYQTQVDASYYDKSEKLAPNIHGAPVYWNGRLYAMPEKDYLKSFAYDAVARTVNTQPQIAKVRSPDGMPGGFLSISANGASDGIVWASMPKGDGQFAVAPGRIVAFDAATLRELWRDDDDVAFSVFTPPTIAGGRVFRATFADELIVYGLTATPIRPCETIDEHYIAYGASDGVIGVPAPGTAQAGALCQDGIGLYKNYVRAPYENIANDACSSVASGADWIASIYWTPSTCAHAVRGGIGALWRTLPANLFGAPGGAERSYLGYPTSDETPTSASGALTDMAEAQRLGLTPAVVASRQEFQFGSIVWSTAGGVHTIVGSIRAKWDALGAERSILGFPTSNETPLPGATTANSATSQSFGNGVIYWHAPDVEAFEVNGAILGRWQAEGPAGQPQQGYLGYPTSDGSAESTTPLEVVQSFQGGKVYFKAGIAGGAHGVRGLILDCFRKNAEERSALGFPMTDEYTPAGTTHRRSDFEHGSIEFCPGGCTGAGSMNVVVVGQALSCR